MGAASSTRGLQFVEPKPWRDPLPEKEGRERAEAFAAKRKAHYAGVHSKAKEAEVARSAFGRRGPSDEDMDVD
eukprot:CAMPEP_0114139552 /NCGR_PEP_ID=MMETSP0043_2-20121206/16916_1 /TAXON_ID=464988 /ORGANISM="Hemiselmis andersenii, Strain CCMP644" /LENGTH=72 /DNA_ID=CAMNT_0001233595 /DNA_START=94 /DNA_END=312 /DNA_ORIENTATION=-